MKEFCSLKVYIASPHSKTPAICAPMFLSSSVKRDTLGRARWPREP